MQHPPVLTETYSIITKDKLAREARKLSGVFW